MLDTLHTLSQNHENLLYEGIGDSVCSVHSMFSHIPMFRLGMNKKNENQLSFEKIDDPNLRYAHLDVWISSKAKSIARLTMAHIAGNPRTNRINPSKLNNLSCDYIMLNKKDFKHIIENKQKDIECSYLGDQRFYTYRDIFLYRNDYVGVGSGLTGSFRKYPNDKGLGICFYGDTLGFDFNFTQETVYPHFNNASLVWHIGQLIR